jgi:hypothetical protein
LRASFLRSLSINAMDAGARGPLAGDRGHHSDGCGPCRRHGRFDAWPHHADLRGPRLAMIDKVHGLPDDRIL